MRGTGASNTATDAHTGITESELFGDRAEDDTRLIAVGEPTQK